ncbi:MAG: N-acetylmuramoyl-L-alanine amidase [Caldimicrobium sp.]|nr:N-acetylmuramoyl-L-alanine amidase [Caldimicrobium sp.]MCX7613046.1 N-acetylmuramoyl-L-alanine amidase [Caldimicrobium sp.]MDW8182803.1 N-acetylmuramoyl-L-alanine amidase [Caldimicrobium sp.]
MNLLKIILLITFIHISVTLLPAEEIQHIVKKGETLKTIAEKYGVTERDIQSWNNLKKTKLKVGQRLIIKKASEDSPKDKVHIVKKGENLKGIAQRYGVTPEEIVSWNNLRGQKVSPGQKLVIKVKAEKPKKEREQKREKEIIYRVKTGETLSQIAMLFNVTEESIMEANNLKGKELRSGQKLLIRVSSKEEKREQDKASEAKSTNAKVADTVSELYHQIQKKEEKLKNLNPTRQDYLTLIGEYRRIYLMYPGSEVAPLALFKTGELYQEIYFRSLKRTDLQEAGKRFELFLKNYPQHPKAENAYHRLLSIYTELKDEEKLKAIQKEWGEKFPKPKSASKREATPTVKERDDKFVMADLKRVLRIEPVTGTDYTRVIVDVSGNFEYQANILPAGKENPARLYIDIYPAVLDDKLQRSFDLQDLHLERVRVGQFDRQTVRVVLDFKSLTDYKIFKIKEPYQLIVDLLGKEKKKETKIAKTSPSKSERLRGQTATATETRETAGKKEEYLNLARQFGLGVKRVVIDPGHGGEDPGALGPNGLKEKDVVLKIAKSLAKKLEDRLGLEVVLTRSTDVFIPLAKRPALANSNKADLFISLHLNAAPDPQARGIETYYLNFTTDPEAMRVAALENRVNDKGLADLQDLVKAILANTKLKESRDLAEKVQRELVRSLSRHYPDIEDRGVKYAPFLVLVGTRMPAILVEASFISNPTCAERLTKEDYLEKISEGLFKGVESYIQSLKLTEVRPLEKR